MNEKWGSVCNLGFKNVEADVACRIMGYSGGKIIGNPNSVGVCSNYNL